ncbi:Uncharacterized [Moorella glycerini]|uniref:Nucleotidyltransferase n=1 Tax=Neomoorella stamsii TaxID=1266720 RepID=A0A9X7J6R1_9FIRM|nr:MULTISPECIES: hypothetical protein [Moorella]PRR77927.1 hypothetical protein MOST_00010 [Moorella stamsii]CEP66428.1 Uncharacterized [Moorella glycerini]
MPDITTIREAFQELLSRIELNPNRVQLASQRYNAVKGTLERALPGYKVTQIGSFQRKTKIRPADLSDKLDIDVVVTRGTAFRFAPPGEGITPQDALRAVRNALSSNRTYKLMEPTTDAPTVILEYADGFTMELVPAFIDKTGHHNHGPGEPDCYLVGTAQGTWVPADYDYDASVISRLNALCGGELVPFIKMCKAFLRNYDVGLKSFHIEVLCTLIIPEAIANWRLQGLRWGYQHLLAYFLSNASPHMLGPVTLPGSFSPGMDSGMTLLQLENTGKLLSKLGALAWKICGLKDSPQALEAWAEFFGKPFPR